MSVLIFRDTVVTTDKPVTCLESGITEIAALALLVIEGAKLLDQRLGRVVGIGDDLRQFRT